MYAAESSSTAAVPRAAAQSGTGTLVLFVHCETQRLYAFRVERELHSAPCPLTPRRRRAQAFAGPSRFCIPNGEKSAGRWRSSQGRVSATSGGSTPRCRWTGRRAASRLTVRQLSPSAHRFVSQARCSPDKGPRYLRSSRQLRRFRLSARQLANPSEWAPAWCPQRPKHCDRSINAFRPAGRANTRGSRPRTFCQCYEMLHNVLSVLSCWRSIWEV